MKGKFIFNNIKRITLLFVFQYPDFNSTQFLKFNRTTEYRQLAYFFKLLNKNSEPAWASGAFINFSYSYPPFQVQVVVVAITFGMKIYCVFKMSL